MAAADKNERAGRCGPAVNDESYSPPSPLKTVNQSKKEAEDQATFSPTAMNFTST